MTAALDRARQVVGGPGEVPDDPDGPMARHSEVEGLDLVTAVLALVVPAATPVVGLDPAVPPIAHGRPVEGLVRTEDLVFAQAAVAPEVRQPAIPRKEPGRDRSSRRIDRPEEKQVAARVDVPDQRLDAAWAVGRSEL